jgi:[ribosomal protein S18]-alanine N-acetyltransferase
VCAELPKEELTQVRPCTRGDLSKVEAILQRSPEAAAWPANALAEAFEHHPLHFFAVWQGEEMAGFICGRRVMDEGEILNLAVKPESRRKGVGKALVEGLLEVFAREGAVQVFLEVRESNASAIAFYQDMGFRLTGKRPGYYQNPAEAALVLARSVGASASTG